MEPDLARRLLGEEGVAAMAEASAVVDPASLASAERLRRGHAPDLAAAALHQVVLRRRAVTRLGDWAADWWWTPDGLEQATRPAVASWRATELVRRGVRAVADLGCGLGVDAAAAADAGLAVVAVERDPVTALLAEANLATRGVPVRCGDAADLAGELLGPGVALLADPARRSTRGRTWQVADFSPSYELIMDLLREYGGVVKFGPGLPYDLIPTWAGATWVSERRDAVEVSLWAPVGEVRRSAVVLPGPAGLLPGLARLAVTDVEAPVSAPSTHLVEPDPAVARAGAIDTLAEQLGASRLDPGIAYLTTDSAVVTPYGTCFEILELWPWKEKALRAWVRDHDIGTLEIKKRGIEVDPAALRRRLRLRGSASATIVITPTVDGAMVLVVERCR